MPVKNKKNITNETIKDNCLNDIKCVNSILNKSKKNSPILNVPDHVKEWMSLPELKKLKITSKEAILNYANLAQYFLQHKHPCTLNNECLYDGFHVGFTRDNNGVLRAYSFECPFKEEYEKNHNFENNFVYRSDIAKINLLGIEDVALNVEKLDNLTEESREITKSFYKLFNWIKKKQELRMGFWYSGKTNLGKTYNVVSLCNSLAKLGYQIAYIDNFELSSKFMNFNSSNDSDKWILIFKQVDILVIDNFGMESNKSTWFYGNILPNILESRMNDKKMTGFISGYSRDQLKKNLKNNTKLDETTIDWIFGKINNLVQTRAKEIKVIKNRK